MRCSYSFVCYALVLLTAGPVASAGGLTDRFVQGRDDLPFSFTYGGKNIAGVFPVDWRADWQSSEAGAQKVHRTATWTDPKTGLEVRCEADVYADFDAVEWVLHLTNNSEKETPIIEDICAGDFTWESGAPSHCELYYAEGSHEKITDFQPMQRSLDDGAPAVFTPFGGRPSDGFLPFFNVAAPDQGIVVALGWTGQWKASFTSAGGRIRVQAGMEKARFKLMPHESVRTPSVLVLPWGGNDRMIGQNLFRRLLLEHYVPRYDGNPVGTVMAASPHAAVGFEKTTETNMIEAIQNIAAHHLPVDYFWIDAGWFACPGNNWARGVGNFEPDPARFPNGLKPVADAVHAAGLKFLLWFEPERVMPGTALFEQHPDWLLKPPAEIPKAIQYQYNDQFHLLDLGRPEAAAWLTETISKQITDIGIDAYRNDFNMYPSFYWRNGEASDRQGITEIRYVQGLLRYFDDLRDQHPKLLLDTCASGGRRIDLEMLKRALILTRSDYLWDPTGQQCHTYGLAQWLPITGIGAASIDRYNCRSGYGAHFSFAVDYYGQNLALWNEMRYTLVECREVASLSRGSFYPLTPYSTENNVCIAWQFHDDNVQSGVIQAFRRQDCADTVLRCVLHELRPEESYVVTDYDTQETLEAKGSYLMSTGVDIVFTRKPAAALLRYGIKMPSL